MTPAEWTEAVRLYDAYWRHSPLPNATIAAWWKKLQHQPGERVQKAIFDLADGAGHPPDVADILARCRTIGNRQAITADTNKRLALTTGRDDWRERQWQQLPPDEQQRWLDKTRATWPDWLPTTSPLFVAHAAALARGVNTSAIPETDPYADQAHCECGAVLLGIDGRGGQCRNCQPRKGRTP